MKCPHSVALTRDIRFHARANASVLYHNHNRHRNERNKKKRPGRELHLTHRPTPTAHFSSTIPKGKEKTETTRVIMHKRRGLTMASVDEKTSGKTKNMK
jgi:hypothetical protein